MIEKESDMSIVRQCNLLSINRGTVYYERRALSYYNESLMRLMDIFFTEDPTLGSRRFVRAFRKRCGIKVGRRRIRRLMRIMGIQAVYPKKRLSMPGKGHKIYPYLLKGLDIDRVNKVWCTDITYLPLKHGHVYLVAVMDWYSRCILSWRISTTFDRAFCVEALKDAISRYGAPEIFNTDQGCQFTSDDFTGVLKRNGIRISMDGKGRAVDNAVIERFWRTLKYDKVYLKEYGNVKECKKLIARFMKKYNYRREHSSLDGNYPAEIYFGHIMLDKAA